MNSPLYQLECQYKIHDNENGECITVGPDADGLNCVEIIDGDTRILLPPEMALFVADAITRCVEDMLKDKENYPV